MNNNYEAHKKYMITLEALEKMTTAHKTEGEKDK